MNIRLKTSELLFDIKNKSHLETASIADAESRYLIEAGTEKSDEIMRGMAESFSEIQSVLLRFLTPDCSRDSYNLLYETEELTLKLEMSKRRHTNRMQLLNDMIHSYIVDRTLAKLYSSESQNDLYDKHNTLAAATLTDIQTLIYTKLPPVR